MSAATEFPPIVHIPERARTARPVAPSRSRRTTTVVPFQFPGAAPNADAVSCLTRVPRPAVARAAQPVPPADAEVMSSAVHLTRRGWVVLLGVTALVAATLLWVAYLSHPVASAIHPAVATPAQVVVQPGDTLWSIAGRVEPGTDPRAVVYDLQQRNHLTSATVVPGQVLRVS